MNDRNILYDRAKGIGIILVILGHLFAYGSLPFAIIFSFHMPLFFFISGIFFHPSANNPQKILIKYLFPFVFFSILGFLVTLFFFSKDGLSFKLFLSETFWNIGADSIMMGALWFLGILALSMIVLSYIIKFQNKQKINNWLIFIILTILAIITEKIPYAIPLRLMSLFAAILFVWLGYISKDKALVYIKHRLIKLLFLPLGMLFLISAYLNKTVNIAIPEYNNFILYIIAALLGIVLILVISQLSVLKMFDFFGRNSLIIFATHAIWLKVYAIIISYIFNYNFELMVNIPVWLCFIGALFVVTLSIPTVFVIKPMYNIIYNKLSPYLIK